LLALSATLVVWASAPTPAQPSRAAREEVRALWVARTTLASPAAIATMVRSAHESGFNTLLVQVRARGDAYYNRSLEPRAQALAGQPASFDPLQVTLAEARKAGLRVHAWINVNLVSSATELPASRDHVIYQHPEWLMVPRAAAKDLRLLNPKSPLFLDRLARAVRLPASEAEGLYLSSVSPAAVEYQAEVVRDLVERYAVDGVHLDYVRYPNDEFDYGHEALRAFAATVVADLSGPDAQVLRARETANPFAFADRYPERWQEFRRSCLTTLVARLRAVVRSVRPKALLTAAVAPDPGEAFARRLQDWRGWLSEGMLDAICPMAYANDVAGFSTQLNAARLAADGRPVWAGIGAYRLSPAQTIEIIQVARKLGAAGVILFSYDSLASASPDGASLSLIGRAAFSQ
jgi:uncharacterized lipoprotein YddW (UPF0748 family)